MLDTISERFERLAPHITEYGPPGDDRLPAVLLFHACNGIRPHIHGYARQAADLGLRAYVIDSFAPRGWDQTMGTQMVCSGMALPGFERSGDVLAAVWGVAQRPEVMAGQLVLAGWSHGAWAMMDLMAQKLAHYGEARLADPDPASLAGVQGMFCVYPYLSFPALSNTHGWQRKPRTLSLLARNDFLTPHMHAEHILAKLRSDGVPVETMTLEASHCFDEDGVHFGPLMQYDTAAHAMAQQAFAGFLKETLDL